MLIIIWKNWTKIIIFYYDLYLLLAEAWVVSHPLQIFWGFGGKLPPSPLATPLIWSLKICIKQSLFTCHRIWATKANLEWEYNFSTLLYTCKYLIFIFNWSILCLILLIKTKFDHIFLKFSLKLVYSFKFSGCQIWTMCPGEIFSHPTPMIVYIIIIALS